MVEGMKDKLIVCNKIPSEKKITQAQNIYYQDN